MTENYISQSRVSNWTRCPYAYKITHVDRLIPLYTPAPMHKGTLTHLGFEHALLKAHEMGGKYPDLGPMIDAGQAAIVSAQKTRMREIKEAGREQDGTLGAAEELTVTAMSVFARAFTALGVHTGERSTVVYDGTPLVEYKMRLPYPGWDGLQGTIDWVAKESSTGHIFKWDFKTTKTPKPREYYDIQLQSPLYQVMLYDRLGLHTAGSITYQIRSEARRIPTLNKTKAKGATKPGMSRAAIITDWSTYREALLAHDLNPADYSAMQAKLPESLDTIYQFFRGAPEQKEAMRTLRLHSEAMLHAETFHEFPRIMNPYGCTGCRHKELCGAELRGESGEYIREHEYQDKDATPENRYKGIEVRYD